MADAFTKWTSGTTAEEQPSNVVPFKSDAFSKWSPTSDPTEALNLATETNPDEVAKNKRLSESLGLPLDAVAVDPITAEKELQKRMVNESLRDSPITKQWISDPVKAAVAHDSTQQLVDTEKLWRPVVDTTVEGVRAIGAGIVGIARNVHELGVAVDELRGIDPLPQDQAIREGLESFQQFIKGDQKNINPMVSSGLESAGQTLPFLFAGPVASIIAAGGQAFSSGYRQAREEGAGPGKAVAFGTVQGGIEILTEKLPIDTFFKSLKAGDNLFKNLFKQMLIELPSEQLATAGQDMSEWLFLHPDKTIGDYLKERPNAALETAVATVVGSSVQTSVAHIGTRFAQKLQASKNAQNFGVKLEATQQQMAASPLAQRDPATAIDHVAAVMRQAGQTEVWLSPDGITKLAEKLEISPFDVATQLGLRAEYEQNYMRGGDISISPEKLGELMLSENWSTLSTHFRQTEDSMTTAEGEEYEKTGLKEELEAALQPQITEESFRLKHGSPHKYDYVKLRGTAFTGEGAQSFGPGFYAADADQVAAHYKALGVEVDLSNLPPDLEEKYGKRHAELTKQLDDLINLPTDGSLEDQFLKQSEIAVAGMEKLKGRSLTTDEVEEIMANIRNNAQYIKAEEYRKQSDSVYKERDAIEEAIYKELKKRAGYFYELQIKGNKEKDFIQWDKPISEQPPKVQKLLDEIKWRDPFNGKEMSLREHLKDRNKGRTPLGVAKRLLDMPQEVQDKYRPRLDAISVELEGLFKAIKLRPDGNAPTNNIELAVKIETLRTEEENIWKEIAETAFNIEDIAYGEEIWEMLREYVRLNANVSEDTRNIENLGTHADPADLVGNEQEFFFKEMKKYGIKGIRYLDQMSRGEGEGTYNYTLYNEDDIVILKRNNQEVNAQAEVDVQGMEQEMGVDGLFQTAEEAGMTPDEYMFYLADLNRTHDAAVAKQNERLLKDAHRKTTKEYKKLRKEAEKEVKQALETLPIYKLINALSIQGDKINREALAALLGDAKWLKDLPKLPSGKTIYTDKGEGGGLDPSALAEAYGYPSAMDMLRGLSAAKTLDQEVNDTTDALMKQRYPDLTDSKLRLESALEAITNDAHTEILTQELNQLRQLKADKQKQKEQNKALKEQGVEKKTLTQEQKDKLKAAAKIRQIKAKVLKAAVKKQLDAMPVGQIKPARFAKAVRDYGKRAGKALRDGDVDSAIDYKFKQTVNFIMAQQAYKVKAEADKQNKYLAKWNNNKSAPKIGSDSIETVRQMLSNYNLGPKLSTKKRKKLQDWVDRQVAAGGIFQIPAQLLADKQQHWASMPLAEWRELVDAIKNIEAQGRNAKVLGKIGQDVDFEHTKARLLASVNAIPDTGRATNKKAGKVDRARDKAAANLSYVDSALVKVENLLRFLDGGSVGEWYKHMFQPTSQAQTDKLDEVTKNIVPLVQKMNKWPKVNKQRLEKKVFVQALNQEMTYSQLLMLALNSGNVSNLEKVVEGHNSTLDKGFGGKPIGNVWTSQNVIDAMALLSPVEARWIQEVWDYLESTRPAVAAVYEAENGTVAQKIETRAVSIGGVQVKGGYFPMMYEYAPAHETALGALQDPFIRASVYSGMTKERTGYVAPVDLNLQNLLPALERNIHFITHYRAVRDNLRILSDNDLVSTIRNKLGEEYVQELKNWTGAVASGNTLGHTPTYVDKTIEFFRRGVTASVLGLSWTTGVSQLFGYSSSIAALGRSSKGEKFSSARGSKYMAIGAWKYLWEKDSVKQAMMLSGELRHRIANTDRELGDALRNVRYKYGPSGVASKAYNWWNKMALTTISGIQTYSVDIPTWIGAFNQGLDDGMSTEDAVQHADSIVRTSQGTGHIKDLSAIQRRKGVMRALTMFSTYSLVLYNMQREAGLAGRKFPISAMSRMMWAVLVPTLLDAALRSDFGPDDDEEETWIGWLGKKTAAYSARSIPLIGTGFASYMEGYSYRASPLEAVPTNLIRAGDAVMKWMEDENDSNWETASELVKGLGMFMGLGGTTQATRLLDALATDDPTLQDYAIGPKEDE